MICKLNSEIKHGYMTEALSLLDQTDLPKKTIILKFIDLNLIDGRWIDCHSIFAYHFALILLFTGQKLLRKYLTQRSTRVSVLTLAGSLGLISLRWPPSRPRNLASPLSYSLLRL